MGFRISFAFPALIVCAGQAFCQEVELDSLKNEFKRAKGTERLTLLIELSRSSNAGGYLDDALNYADQAVTLATARADSFKLTSATRMRGVALRKLERLEESLVALEKAYGIATRNGYKSELKYLTNSLSLVHGHFGNFDKALQYSLESLAIREEEGDDFAVSLVLNNIGTTYYSLGNLPKALHFFKRALALRQASGDTYDLDRLLINIGVAENALGHHEEGIKKIHEALAICGGKCSDTKLLEAQHALGFAYYRLDQYDSAFLYLTKALHLAMANQEVRLQAETDLILGSIELRRGQVKAGEKHLTRAKDLAHERGFNALLLQVYPQLAFLAKAKGNIQEEVEWQRLYIKLRDDLLSEKFLNEFAQIEAKFEERENRKALAEKEQILRLKQEIIDKQRIQNFSALAVIVLIVFFVFLLVRANARQKSINNQLSFFKKALEEKNVALNKANTELDHHVHERTVELFVANNKLKQVNDDLDKLLTRTAQDIKRPLATLTGLISVAKLEVKDAVALGFFEQTGIAANAINSILTKLIVLNRIAESTPHYEQFSLDDIIRSIQNPMLANGSIRQTGFFQRIKSDRKLLSIALEHLLCYVSRSSIATKAARYSIIVDVMHIEGGIDIRIVDEGAYNERAVSDPLMSFVTNLEASDPGSLELYIATKATEKIGGMIYAKEPPNSSYTEVGIVLFTTATSFSTVSAV